jgi:methyl-accepting chemotaxis protein
MKTPAARPEKKFRRKIHYINPRFQGGAVLVFSAVIVAGGILFGGLVYRDLGRALWSAAMQGHYMMDTPYEIVRDALLWHLAGLSATVTCLGVIVFLFLVRAIRRGIGRVIEVLLALEDGDLSTPTDARGLTEFARFGERVDAARAHTLTRIVALREEGTSLLASGLPQEEFRSRWDEFKRKIREVAP